MNGLCWAKNFLSQRFSFSLTISEHHMGEAQQPRNCSCRRQSLAVRGVPFEVARDRLLASSLALTRNGIELPLKLKPEGHFLPYRCFGLWYSRSHPSWLFPVTLLTSGGWKQSDVAYRLALFFCVCWDLFIFTWCPQPEMWTHSQGLLSLCAFPI